jgi:hypothetical protein
MFQLLVIGGIVDFLSPGSFTVPLIAKYTQAMKNILLQPTSVRSISTVNILTTVFNKIPDDIAKRLSPLTTHKSMHHISKNFAWSLLSCNFQQTNLDSLSYETNSITVLSFVEQSNLGKNQCISRCQASCKKRTQVQLCHISLQSIEDYYQGSRQDQQYGLHCQGLREHLLHDHCSF